MVLTRIASNLFRSSTSYPYGYRTRDRPRSISVKKRSKIRGREREHENSPPPRPLKRLRLVKSIASLNISEESAEQEQKLDEGDVAIREAAKAKRKRVARARARAYASSVPSKGWAYRRLRVSSSATRKSPVKASMDLSTLPNYSSCTETTASLSVELESSPRANALGLTILPLPTSPPHNMDVDQHDSEMKRYAASYVNSAMSSDSLASTSVSGRVRLAFPRRLPDHANPNVPIDFNILPKALVRAYPILADVPLEYVRRRLWEGGYRLMHVLARVAVSLGEKPSPAADSFGSNDARCPKKMHVSFQPTADEETHPSDLPTHIIAVHGPLGNQIMPGGPKTRTKISLYPVHDVILLSQCPHPLLVSVLLRDGSGGCFTGDDSEATSSESKDGRSVPVVSLQVPSPKTFGALLKYLYTGHIEGIDIFSPNTQSSSAPSTPSLQPKYPVEVDYSTIRNKEDGNAEQRRSLLKRMANINGLWKNACALGIISPGGTGSSRILRTMLEGAWADGVEDLSRAYVL